MKTVYEFITDEGCTDPKGIKNWGLMFTTREACEKELARRPHTYQGKPCEVRTSEVFDEVYDSLVEAEKAQ